MCLQNQWQPPQIRNTPSNGNLLMHSLKSKICVQTLRRLWRHNFLMLECYQQVSQLNVYRVFKYVSDAVMRLATLYLVSPQLSIKWVSVEYQLGINIQCFPYICTDFTRLHRLSNLYNLVKTSLFSDHSPKYPIHLAAHLHVINRNLYSDTIVQVNIGLYHWLLSRLINNA